MSARSNAVIAGALTIIVAFAACQPAKSCPWSPEEARGGLSLSDAERAVLGKYGFVITDRKRFGSFVDGWLSIYKADLPLYVSADALLHVVHRSYDKILKDIEIALLLPRLQRLLEAMRERLAGRDGKALGTETRADADFFIGVALGLLEGQALEPVAGADANEIDRWVAKGQAALGAEEVPLFGSSRFYDFSQLKPRGHYADDSDVQTMGRSLGMFGPVSLAPYFRAVMWLGRTDLRFAWMTSTGAYVLNRRELALACALRSLMGPTEMSAWAQLETTMNAFVGDRDAMGPGDVDRFYRDLGIARPADLAGIPNEKILAVLLRGQYGNQRIATQILSEGAPGHTAPLPKTFSFTGQRYIVDSHVFSEVVHDRVPHRMMPDPLDVAYAVFDSAPAKDLLAPELARYGYASKLQALHDSVQSNGEAFWQSSLYNLWVGAIRALSPSASPASSAPPASSVLPRVATSEAWNRRMLSTQLASWAELRHDTILYAEQSYTAFVVICSFPDVYVDPYPAFYARLGSFADKGKKLVGALDFGSATDLRKRIDVFFSRLRDAAEHLGRIAERQEHGKRPSADDLDFVNHAVDEEPQRSSGGCGGGAPRVVRGWYVDLFFDGGALDFKPTIADVHTQPSDENGNVVGRVLHVGTAEPRLMVVDVDVGGGRTREFTGVVSSYHEIITSDFARLDDRAWRAKLHPPPGPEEVPWMLGLVVPWTYPSMQKEQQPAKGTEE